MTSTNTGTRVVLQDRAGVKGRGQLGPWALWWLLGAGVIVRLGLVPLPGYDVEIFRVWSDGLAREGLTRAYELKLETAINYPPVSISVFWALGRVYRGFAGWESSAPLIPAYLIKLAIIAADAAAIVMMAVLLRRCEWEGRRGSLLWVGAYALHPAVIWNTAYWAGIDAMVACLVLLVLIFFLPRRFALALALAIVAVFVKPLAASVWFLVMWIMFREQGRSNIWWGLAVSAGITFLLYLPWVLQGNLIGALGTLGGNFGNIGVLSANAHNLWWVLSGGDGWRTDSDARVIGLLYLVAAVTWALRLLPREPNANQILHTCAYLLMALPMLLTEVHENWSLTAFAPLVAACAIDSRIRPVFYLFSVTVLINLIVHDPGLRAAMGRLWNETALYLVRLSNALIATATFALWTTQLPRYLAGGAKAMTAPERSTGLTPHQPGQARS